jgi:hypothetical protein
MVRDLACYGRHGDEVEASVGPLDSLVAVPLAGAQEPDRPNVRRRP